MERETEIWLISAAALTAVSGWYYFSKKEKAGRRVLVFKALATLMPVLLALRASLSASSWGQPCGWLIFCGAFFCMTADVLLELVFLTGVFSFALAHICFLAAFIHMVHIRWYTVFLFVLLFLFMLLFHDKVVPRFGKQSVFLYAYGALLCAMTAMAVSAALQHPGGKGVVTAAGGICFYLSDNILGWRILNERKERSLGAVLLVLYYGAVYLIAASCLL